ncbi:hypothetical protein IOD13_18390 [Brevibacterium casei]|nr:hypothetical protein [Brevibacterium casei]
MDELEFASAGGDIVGVESGVVEEVGEGRDDRADRRCLDAAVAEVDAVELGIEDAQRHRTGAPPTASFARLRKSWSGPAAAGGHVRGG